MHAYIPAVALADFPPIVSTISVIDIISLILLPIVLPWVVGKIVANKEIPQFWKRLMLFGAALVMTLGQDLVEAAASGAAYDITWGLVHFIAAYGGAEGVYKLFYKASLEAPPTLTPVAVEVEGVNLKALTKAELIDLIEAPPAEVTVTAAPEPRSISTIIQNK